MNAVLLKSYFLWPYATGGERSQTATMAALARAGCTVSVRYAIPPGLPQAAYDQFRQLIDRFAIPVNNENERSISYMADGIPFQARPVSGTPSSWLGDWLDELNPDLVFASAKDTWFLPALTAFWPGPGFIFIQDLSSLESMNTFLSPDFLSRLIRLDWTFIASSHFLKNRASEQLGIESSVLYPIVHPEPTRTPIPASGPVIMFGSDEGKGFDIFLGIARLLTEQRFATVCGWEQKPPTTSDIIDYLPFELSPVAVFKRSRAVVVPSRYEEGFGRVAFEAMAHGRPVVTSDRGALPEVVGNAGIVVPLQHDTSSIGEWVNAVNMILDREMVDDYVQAGLDRSRTIVRIRSRQFEQVFGVPYSAFNPPHA